MRRKLPCKYGNQDQQDAHGKVLEGVGEPSGDPVDDRRARPRIGGLQAAEHDGERDQQDEDDHAGEAYCDEVADVSDAYLPRRLRAHEG